MIIYVTKAKERPIGAIGAVRARAGRRALIPCMSLMRGGTQHMSLSAADVQTRCSGSMPAPSSIVLLMEYARIHHRRTVEVDWM